ncbi:MAG: 2-oxoacid:acceptor oxidoreductase subunit alpha [Spirochaetales bacterium]|nr:2-oxoacid:acceptor oxidoreductase subunit alpha [Spirochaetales bacterium]
MKNNDFVVKVATVNGSGSASANSLLSKSLFRMGIPVSVKNIFPSNIQGLPTWYEIRANGDGFTARSPRISFLVAMNPQTFEQDIAEVSTGGFVLFDSTWPIAEEIKREDITFLDVPLTAMSVEAFPNVKLRMLMKNITYVGATAALLDIDLEEMRALLNETYSKKPHLSEANMNAIELSYNFVKENFPCPLPFHAERMDGTKGKILINGNTACALGSLYAGATVAAWYPITPATSVTDAFRQLCGRYRKDPETGKIAACIIQAEDEIAAIGMAVGAGWAGARTFTPTSGAGISLMNEFLGFAYFTEIPIVVFNVQRAGPSTGMPTRTQQADILSSAFASHGDTRHIVLFPADPEECFYLSVRSFDIAERFQTPVLVLSDLDIGMNDWMTDPLEWDDSYSPDRGKVLGTEELDKIDHFYRYLDSDGDGICYRTLPGIDPKGAYFLRGTGHNQFAAYSEKGAEYVENTTRLMRKFETASHELPKPVIHKSGNTDLGIISIGGCDRAVKESLHLLSKEDVNIDYMRIRSFPFGNEVQDFFDKHDRCVVIEQNRDAQLRSLLILETTASKEKLSSILNYGGLPPDAGFLSSSLRTIYEGEGYYELWNKA